MSKIKIENLSNAQLDHAVHMALGLGYREDFKYGKMYIGLPDKSGSVPWDNIPKYYSTDWGLAGLILEINKIDLYYSSSTDTWTAAMWKDLEGGGQLLFKQKNCPTSPVALLRCFVMSKLGDEVEIPEDIK